MRVFQNKNWEYSANIFDRLSKKKEWSVRYRIEYAQQLGQDRTLRNRLRSLVTHFLAFANLWRSSIVWQSRPFTIKGRKFIVLLSSYGGYVKHIMPVARELINRGNDVVFLCPGKQYDELKTTLPVEVSNRLYPFESLTDKSDYFFRFFHLLHSVTIGQLEGLWFCFQPLKHSFFYSTTFCRYAFTQHLLDAYLKRTLDPGHVIIAANDHWMWESIMFRSAVRAGAQTYELQHGMLEEQMYPMFTNNFLAWGGDTREKMIHEFGAPGDIITIVGSPYFDEVYADISNKKLDDSFDRPFITFLSQPFADDGYFSRQEFESIISRFYSLQSIADKYGKKLLVKLHPRENGRLYEGKPSNVELTSDPLFDVLAKSCLTITVDSTAIFESVMFKVPAIQTVLPHADRQMIFADSGVCLISRSGEELANSVSAILAVKNNYYERVAQGTSALDHYFQNLGNSLEKIMKLIER